MAEYFIVILVKFWKIMGGLFLGVMQGEYISFCSEWKLFICQTDGI